MCSSTSARTGGTKLDRIVSRHASVVTVKPAGTGMPSGSSPRARPLAAEQVAATGGLLVERVHESHGADPMQEHFSRDEASGGAWPLRAAAARSSAARWRRPSACRSSSSTRYAHQAGWTELDATELRRRVEPIVEGIPGSWTASTAGKLGDLVLERADTVVWIDLPVACGCRGSYGGRSRASWREELWNGNRSPCGGSSARTRSCARAPRRAAPLRQRYPHGLRGSASRASARRGRRAFCGPRGVAHAVGAERVRHPILSRRSIGPCPARLPGALLGCATPGMPENWVVDDSAHIRREGHLDGVIGVDTDTRAASPELRAASEARGDAVPLAGRATRA